MKKIVALVLCLVMVVGLMTGCQKAMDLDTLVQKMDEAMAAATHTAGKLNMELDLQLGTAGVTMDMGVDAAMEMKLAIDMSAAWMDLDMTMDILGESQDMGTEIYMNTDGEDMVMYMLDGTTGTWIKSREEGYAEQAAQNQANVVKFSDMPREKMTLAEEKETVDGRECYVLTVNMDGEYFQSMIDSSLAMTADEASRELLEAMDWSKLSTVMTYHVDAETFLPVQMTGELQGLGDMMGSLVGQMLGGMEGMDMSVTVPTCKFAMTEMNYTGVEVPAVPQEAIDNAVDADELAEDPTIDDGELGFNEPQPDGSYLLSLDHASVRVMLPEDFPEVTATENYLTAMNQEGTVYLTYDMVPDMTAADMDAGIMAEVDWAVANDYYKSHSEPEELNGFGTMGIVYNDNTSFWYIWKELEGCMLVIGAETMGETCDLAALIATVEIPA